VKVLTFDNELHIPDISQKSIRITLLIKEDAFDIDMLKKYYIDPLFNRDHSIGCVIAVSLLYNGKKVNATIGKAYLELLLKEASEALPDGLPKTIICADGPYFKFLTKRTKITDVYGEKVPCTLKGWEQFSTVYVPNYGALFYNPENINIIKSGLDALITYKSYDIINSGEWAYDQEDARYLLLKCLTKHSLTCDIETTGTMLGSKIISISFAWDCGNGIAIYNYPGWYKDLKFFFEAYRKQGGKLIFHRASFDVKILIYELWMRGPCDIHEMFKGLQIFRTVEDSQLLTYLARNSTADISLGLKENSYEWAGNYGIDVKDASTVEPKKLLTYNLKDCLATWYVWEKYWPVCETDKQLKVYADIFQPSLLPFLQMMILGLPIDLDQVDKVEKQLMQTQSECRKAIFNNWNVILYTTILQNENMKAANAKLKVKVHPFYHFADTQFNPGSGKQVAGLLYDYLQYPITELTDTGKPSTSGKALKALIGHGKHDDLIQKLLDLAEVNKILNTFVRAFKKNTIENFLRGTLNLGGTQSGRLSSSDES
jgi:DNA polymerase-1